MAQSQDDRQARLAVALRENLKRRKAQARGRTVDTGGAAHDRGHGRVAADGQHAEQAPAEDGQPGHGESDDGSRMKRP